MLIMPTPQILNKTNHSDGMLLKYIITSLPIASIYMKNMKLYFSLHNCTKSDHLCRWLHINDMWQYSICVTSYPRGNNWV